jgi:hypothetical protein
VPVSPKVSVHIEGGQIQGIVGSENVRIESFNIYNTSGDKGSTKATSGYDYILPDTIFIQYINPEILTLYSARTKYSDRYLYKIAIRLTKLAILLSDRLVMPATYAVEVPFINQFIREVSPIISQGLIYISSSTSDWKEYLREKSREYRDELNIFRGYVKEELSPILMKSNLIWIPRIKSSSRDIANLWQKEMLDGGMWQDILNRLAHQGTKLPANIETTIYDVPNALDGRAFIHRFAVSCVPISFEPSQHTSISMLLSRGYLESYLNEYDASILVDTPIGILDCNLPKYNISGKLLTISFRRIWHFLTRIGIEKYITDLLDWYSLIDLQRDFIAKWIMNMILRDTIDVNHPFEKAIVSARFSKNPTLNTNSPMAGIKEVFYRLFDATYPHMI